MPRALDWFTGSIGYHHVHHLAPRVPNYFLRACHARISEIVSVRALGLREALRAWRWALWDEQAGRMVGWPGR
jgi:omega-6 fatty acid desaturase (delta-12 desaturase)